MREHGKARVLRRMALALFLATGLTACASPGDRRAAMASADNGVMQQVVEVARKQQGRPYRYGGASPSGFDCSGLVQYAYRQAGIEVPRTTREQYRSVRRLHVHQLEPGDLVFFNTRTVRATHVGIYLGDGRFVHALNPEHPVRIDRLDNGYWEQRIILAGSLLR